MRNNIIELINAIKNSSNEKEEKDYLYNYLTERLEKLPIYVNNVFMMNMQMPILRARFDEPSELEYQITKLDEKRRIAHNSAIDACRQINRLQANLNCKERFYPENLENVEITSELRHNVAKFVGEFVNETFKEEIMDKHQDFVKGISDNQIREMEKDLDDEYER